MTQFTRIVFGMFLLGIELSAAEYPIHGTFLNFYRNFTPGQWAREFQDMRDVDIDTVIVLSVGRLRSGRLSPEGLLYPSEYVAASERPTSDRLEMILSLADRHSMNVLLGSLQTEGEWTDGSEFDALRQYNQRVAAEILQRYGHHRSLKGWYFTQEVWMNWVKHYGDGYYGTRLIADWISDLKKLDATKVTIAAVVVKKAESGSMPGLTPVELEQWTVRFLRATSLDILAPQDGIGAESGAPTLKELPSYYRAMALAVAAAGTKTVLWDTLETFTSLRGLSGVEYPPADISRIRRQVRAVRPYVTGYISWIFGDDLSPQATHYRVAARELNQQFKNVFRAQTCPSRYDR